MVTPFSLAADGDFGFVFGFAFDFDAAAVLVSITDDLVFLEGVGSGLLALPVFTGVAGFAGSLFAATLRTPGLLAGTLALTALTGAASFFGLLAGTDFFGVGAFLLTTLAFDFAAATGFDFTAAFDTAFLTGFAAALAVGLARATTLVDLGVVLVFCVDFAISVLTL